MSNPLNRRRVVSCRIEDIFSSVLPSRKYFNTTWWQTEVLRAESYCIHAQTRKTKKSSPRLSVEVSSSDANVYEKRNFKFFICGEEQKYHHFDTTRHDWRQTSFQHSWTIAPQGCLPYWAVHWTARYGECRIGFNTVTEDVLCHVELKFYEISRFDTA